MNGLAAPYLNEFIPQQNAVPYNTRNKGMLHVPGMRTKRFQVTFFPYTLSEWNVLDPEIRNLPSLSSFKMSLLRFVRPFPASVYDIHDPQGTLLLTRLRVGFSHLREHKFRHNFNDTEDPVCNCRTNCIETTEHYLLHCPNFSLYRTELFSNLHQTGLSLPPFSVSHLTKIFLYGDAKFSIVCNRVILKCVINFIINSKRFSGSLFD